jgi:hypothetical protein
MDNRDTLKQLRDCIRSAYPTDREEISLVRQLGTLEGILSTLMATNTEVKDTVQMMLEYYQEMNALRKEKESKC